MDGGQVAFGTVLHPLLSWTPLYIGHVVGDGFLGAQFVELLEVLQGLHVLFWEGPDTTVAVVSYEAELLFGLSLINDGVDSFE